MRAYFLGNMYMSSIQQGIQAGHVVSEMFTKYRESDGHDPMPESLYSWAFDHKTMILLNGGYGENLHEFLGFMEGVLDEPSVTRLSECYDGYSPYPFAHFCESDEALDGAITSVGVILPNKIYGGAREMQRVKRLQRDDISRRNFEMNKVLVVPEEDGTKTQYEYNAFEIELMERLNKFKLAQ